MRDRWIADLRARGVHQRWILFAGLAGMFAGMFPFTVLAVSLKNIAAENEGLVQELVETELIPWLEKTEDPWLDS